MNLLESLIQEGREDRGRPWWKRSTGGLLVAVVLLAIAGQILLEALLDS